MAKERSNNLKTAINLISSVGVLVINLCISFFLSPYIIKNIGVEANGFVTLANNFVMYADLVVTALNAMAARFITISYVKKDYKTANMYYNSVFWGNLIIVAFFLLPATFLIVFLQNTINLPMDIELDVKILFSLVFLGFFIRTGAPNYDCGTYVTNRMDLSYIPTIITALFRCVFLVCVFSIWTPRVWFVSLSALIVTVFKLIVAGHYTHSLTPELKVQLKSPICSLNAIKELVGGGIWSSIGSAGFMLLNGLDLLVCNKFIGATAMGIIAISKTLSSIVVQLSDTIRATFAPELTIFYAQEDKEKIFLSIRRAMKILSVIITIPTAGIVVMGDAFYKLWLPSQDARLLQVLTVLSLLSLIFNSGVAILLNVFSMVNKPRINSIVMIISGFISIVITVIVIKFTNLGIYAVAGVSSIVTIGKNLFFVIPTATRYLGFKWHKFYPVVGTSVICSCISVAVGFIIRAFMPVNTWLFFMLTSCLMGVTCLVINMYIVLSKDERNFLINVIRRKIKRKK